MDLIESKSPVPEEKKCFHRCMARKLGTMNEDDEVTLEAFKERLINGNASPALIENIENCDVTPQPDPCDTAVALKDCIVEE